MQVRSRVSFLNLEERTLTVNLQLLAGLTVTVRLHTALLSICIIVYRQSSISHAGNRLWRFNLLICPLRRGVFWPDCVRVSHTHVGGGVTRLSRHDLRDRCPSERSPLPRCRSRAVETVRHVKVAPAEVFDV